MHTPPAPSKPDALAQDPSPTATPGLLTAEVAGRLWQLSRPADLESLWAEMGEAEFGDDERLPYWVELWPAAVLLARFVALNAGAVRGKVCLDAGCGLGLSALVAASVGGRVLGFDYEPEALVYARRNTTLNQQLLGACAPPLFTVMDWRAPALARGTVDLLLGADILYEKRFFEPVAALLDHALAPDGAAFIADPERSVSAPVWARLTALGWNVTTPFSGRVAQGGQDMFVHIRKISRPRRGQPPTETCKEP